MKISSFIMLTAVTGLTITIMLSGCKKQEPTMPHEHEHSPEATVEQTPSAKGTPAPAAAAVEQTNCPVMGGKINKDIFVEYKGKKVYFCCPMCVDQFNKDPEKYLSKLPQFQN